MEVHAIHLWMAEGLQSRLGIFKHCFARGGGDMGGLDSDGGLGLEEILEKADL